MEIEIIFMVPRAEDENYSVNEENISYYDAIAAGYDQRLNQEHSNKIIREQVAELFQALVPLGNVLDFGGGTGQDLEWLIKKGYKIFFCEPSSGMREKAIILPISIANSRQIQFINSDHTDFVKWLEIRPIPSDLQGILANFAVINNIENIGLLFKSLAILLQPGGHLIALMLNSRSRKNLRIGWKHRIRSLVTGNPFIITIKSEDKVQTVFIHSMNQIKRTSAAYFKFHKKLTVPDPRFFLIHLVRK